MTAVWHEGGAELGVGWAAVGLAGAPEALEAAVASLPAIARSLPRASLELAADRAAQADERARAAQLASPAAEADALARRASITAETSASDRTARARASDRARTQPAGVDPTALIACTRGLRSWTCELRLDLTAGGRAPKPRPVHLSERQERRQREDPGSGQAGCGPRQRQQGQGHRRRRDAVSSDGLEWKPNPFDEYAVETALRLNENAPKNEKLGETIVVSFGPDGRRADPAPDAGDGRRPRHPGRGRRQGARLAGRRARAQGASSTRKSPTSC